MSFSHILPSRDTYKHVNWRIESRHGRSLRYRAVTRLHRDVPLLPGIGSYGCCALRRIVNGGRCCSCGGGSSSGCRSTGSTRRNRHRCTSRWRRRRSEAILQRHCRGKRNPVHRFGLYSSHDRFSLLANNRKKNVTRIALTNDETALPEIL